MSFEDLVDKALEGESEKGPEELMEELGDKKDELKVTEDNLSEKKSGPDSAVTSAVKGAVKGVMGFARAIMGKDSALERMEEKNPKAVEKIKGLSVEQLESHVVNLKSDIVDLQAKLARAMNRGGSNKGSDKKGDEKEGLEGELNDNPDLEKLSGLLAVGNLSEVKDGEIPSSGLARDTEPSKEEGRSQ